MAHLHPCISICAALIAVQYFVNKAQESLSDTSKPWRHEVHNAQIYFKTDFAVVVHRYLFQSGGSSKCTKHRALHLDTVLCNTPNQNQNQTTLDFSYKMDQARFLPSVCITSWLQSISFEQMKHPWWSSRSSSLMLVLGVASPHLFCDVERTHAQDMCHANDTKKSLDQAQGLYFKNTPSANNGLYTLLGIYCKVYKSLECWVGDNLCSNKSHFCIFLFDQRKRRTYVLQKVQSQE